MADQFSLLCTKYARETNSIYNLQGLWKRMSHQLVFPSPFCGCLHLC